MFRGSVESSAIYTDVYKNAIIAGIYGLMGCPETAVHTDRARSGVRADWMEQDGPAFGELNKVVQLGAELHAD